MKNFIRPSSNCYDAAKAAKIKVPKRYEKHNMEVSEWKWGIPCISEKLGIRYTLFIYLFLISIVSAACEV